MAVTWLSSWQLEEAWSLPVWVLAVLEVKCKGSGLCLASQFQFVSLLEVIFGLQASPD